MGLGDARLCRTRVSSFKGSYQMIKELLIFSIISLVFSCSGPQVGESSRDLDFLWVVKQNGEYRGGMASAALHVVPSTEPGMKVGLFETRVGGTGTSWRATVWLSAILGSLLVGELPVGHRFWIETQALAEKVDGPSAGALFTVAVMAALRGDSILPGRVMTGTICPDGSIGPVEGIPQKFEAAAAEGKTMLGYPAGQETTRDLVSGKDVSLTTLALDRGAQARELQDIWQAYQFMTGKEPIRPRPLEPASMAPRPDIARVLMEKASSNLLQARELAKELEKVEDPLSEWLVQTFHEVDVPCLKTRELLDGTESAQAYRAGAECLEKMSAASSLASLEVALRQGRREEALLVLPELLLTADSRFKALVEEMDRVVLANPNQVVVLLDSYEALLEAFESIESAVRAGNPFWARLLDRKLQSADLDQLNEETVEELRRRIRAAHAALAALRRARDYLGLADLGEGARVARVQPETIDDLRVVYEALGETILEYFDSLFIQSLAERAKKDLDTTRARFMGREELYRKAFLHLRLPPTRLETFVAAGGQSHRLGRLAGAVSSAFFSSSLIARYMSVEVKLEKGKVVGVSRPDSLLYLLKLAEISARQAGGDCRDEVGRIPASASIEYELGKSLMTGETAVQKLTALDHFWRSARWSQVAASISRAQKREGKRGEQ